jgi:hypothetical protein
MTEIENTNSQQGRRGNPAWQSDVSGNPASLDDSCAEDRRFPRIAASRIPISVLHMNRASEAPLSGLEIRPPGAGCWLDALPAGALKLVIALGEQRRVVAGADAPGVAVFPNVARSLHRRPLTCVPL